MKRLRLILALAAALTVQSAAQANDLIEIRGGIGLVSSSPDTFEDRVNAVGNSDVKLDKFDVYNVDVFFNLPGPIGVGLRHEWLDADDDSNGNKLDLEAKNFSVLVDWRIIDTGFYVGPIVGIGYPDANVTIENAGSRSSDEIKSGEPSYSVGAELGFHLGSLLIGTEAGYQSLKLDEVDGTNNNIDAKVDLSGFYGKVMVGFSFL